MMTVLKKLKLIENYYNGYKAIITTCGPSFNNKDDILSMVDSKTILICVKQTYEYIGISDFFIMDEPEKIKNIKHKYCVPIRFGAQNPTRTYYDKNKNIQLGDIIFRGFGNRSRTLYDIPKNIDTMTFKHNALSDNKMIVHYAHAMHGFSLPLCIHLGIKNTFIIGWDGHKRNNKNSHFYPGSKIDLSEYGSTAVTKCNEHITDFIKNNFNKNIYQINTLSLYEYIPKKTVHECIDF